MKRIILIMSILVFLTVILYAENKDMNLSESASVETVEKVSEDQAKDLVYEAEELIKNKEYEKAEEILDKALTISPLYIKAYTAKLYMALNLGKTEDIIENLDKMIELDCKSETKCRMLKALNYIADNNPKKAFKESKKIAKHNPESPVSYYINALAYHSLLNIKKAETNIDKALELLKDDCIYISLDEIYYLKGLLNIECGEYDKAAENFLKAKPYLLISWLVGSALTEIEKKDYSSAEIYLKELIEKYPGKSVTWFIKGRLEYVKENYEEAINSFNDALMINPMMYEVYYHLAGSYIFLKDYEKAYENLILYTQKQKTAYIYKDDLEKWSAILKTDKKDKDAVKVNKIIKSKLKKRDRILKR